MERSSIPLGGISVPCFYKVDAHSDGDVLLHALVDACLGALALGDIGRWFPNNKPENKNRPSSEFVTEVLAHIHKMGWKVTQFDSNVVAEEPKLNVHSDAIRAEIARLLGTELSSVSVKAKTMEGLGPIGERRAIAAHAIVVLEEIR